MGESHIDRGGAGEETRRFPLYEWLVVLAVVGFLICLVIPAIDIAREQARQSLCRNNLLQIGMGLAMYREASGRFPAAYEPDASGQPWSSWRVAIMPYFTCSAFCDQYTFSGEPWNSPGNLELARREEYLFRCGSQPPELTTASYLAVTGATTGWPGVGSRSLNELGKPTYNVILLVESRNSGIYWTEPRDLMVDSVDFSVDSPPQVSLSIRKPGAVAAVSSEHPGGAHVLLADGSMLFLASDTDSGIVRDMLRITRDATRVVPGPRRALRLVYDPDAARGPKSLPYRWDWYWVDGSEASARGE